MSRSEAALDALAGRLSAGDVIGRSALSQKPVNFSAAQSVLSAAAVKQPASRKAKRPARTSARSSVTGGKAHTRDHGQPALDFWLEREDSGRDGAAALRSTTSAELPSSPSPPQSEREQIISGDLSIHQGNDDEEVSGHVANNPSSAASPTRAQLDDASPGVAQDSLFTEAREDSAQVSAGNSVDLFEEVDSRHEPAETDVDPAVIADVSSLTNSPPSVSTHTATPPRRRSLRTPMKTEQQQQDSFVRFHRTLSDAEPGALQVSPAMVSQQDLVEAGLLGRLWNVFAEFTTSSGDVLLRADATIMKNLWVDCHLTREQYIDIRSWVRALLRMKASGISKAERKRMFASGDWLSSVWAESPSRADETTQSLRFLVDKFAARRRPHAQADDTLSGSGLGSPVTDVACERVRDDRGGIDAASTFEDEDQASSIDLSPEFSTKNSGAEEEEETDEDETGPGSPPLPASLPPLEPVPEDSPIFRMAPTPAEKREKRAASATLFEDPSSPQSSQRGWLSAASKRRKTSRQLPSDSPEVTNLTSDSEAAESPAIRTPFVVKKVIGLDEQERQVSHRNSDPVSDWLGPVQRLSVGDNSRNIRSGSGAREVDRVAALRFERTRERTPVSMKPFLLSAQLEASSVQQKSPTDQKAPIDEHSQQRRNRRVSFGNAGLADVGKSARSAPVASPLLEPAARMKSPSVHDASVDAGAEFSLTFGSTEGANTAETPMLGEDDPELPTLIANDQAAEFSDVRLFETSVDDDLKQMVTLFVKRNPWGISRAPSSESASHLIVGTSEDAAGIAVARRTGKVMRGILAGIWILQGNVVAALNEAATSKEWINEEDFEVRGLKCNTETVFGAPRKARLALSQPNAPRLFEGLQFHFFGHFTLGEREMADLVKVGGAGVTDAATAQRRNRTIVGGRDPKRGVVVIVDAGKISEGDIELGAQRFHRFLVSADWVYDSISQYAVLDQDSYTLGLQKRGPVPEQSVAV